MSSLKTVFHLQWFIFRSGHIFKITSLEVNQIFCDCSTFYEFLCRVEDGIFGSICLTLERVMNMMNIVNATYMWQKESLAGEIRIWLSRFRSFKKVRPRLFPIILSLVLEVEMRKLGFTLVSCLVVALTTARQRQHDQEKNDVDRDGKGLNFFNLYT